ncbi:hypothetical protein ACGLWX_05830 [Halomonas sp. HMF6819]|uniref:hypothetical protein n=1 Tax=Halomonas sp. HMF6819 TaxID=3373085 RepID=UPI0037BC5BD4
MSAMTDKFEYLFETTEMLKEGANKALLSMGREPVADGSPLRAYAEALLDDGMTIPQFIESLLGSNPINAFYVTEAEFLGQVTLWQDIAMTVPVKEIGDPIAAQYDISGNGNHRFARVSAGRPVYNMINGRGFIDSRNVEGFSFTTDRALNLNNGFVAMKVTQTVQASVFSVFLSPGSGGLGYPATRNGTLLHQTYDLINTPTTFDVNSGACLLRMTDGVVRASHANGVESTVPNPSSYNRKNSLGAVTLHYNYAANDPRYQITGLLGPMVLSEAPISVADSRALIEWMDTA